MPSSPSEEASCRPLAREARRKHTVVVNSLCWPQTQRKEKTSEETADDGSSSERRPLLEYPTRRGNRGDEEAATVLALRTHSVLFALQMKICNLYTDIFLMFLS